MSTTRIRLLAVLATVAMLALVAYQGVQLRESYVRANALFGATVRSALAAVQEQVDPGDELHRQLDLVVDPVGPEEATADAEALAHGEARANVSVDGPGAPDVDLDPGIDIEARGDPTALPVVESIRVAVQRNFEDRVARALADRGITESIAVYLTSSTAEPIGAPDAMGPGATRFNIPLRRQCPGCDVRLWVAFPALGVAARLSMILGPIMVSATLALVLAVTLVITLRALVRLRRQNAAQVAFINNLAHEYRTPIFTISVASRILGEHPAVHGDPVLAEQLGAIARANRRLSDQAEQVLEVAALEGAEPSLRVEPVELAEMVESAVAVLRPAFAEAGGAISVRPAPGDTTMLGDRRLLGRIVENLLDNARKYGGAPPEATVAIEREGDDLVLTVRDRGPGIPPGEEEAIFAPYRRIATGDRHEVKGVGLGLSLVRRAARAHGGGARVVRDGGVGACLEVRLPARTTVEAR